MEGRCSYDSLVAHGLPPSGLGFEQRKIAGERAIMRAAGSRQRLPPSAGAGAVGIGLGAALCIPPAVWGAEAEGVLNNSRMTVEAMRGPRLNNKLISKSRLNAPLAPLPNGTGWGGGVPLVVDVRQSGVGNKLWERQAGLRWGGESALPDPHEGRSNIVKDDADLQPQAHCRRRRSEDNTTSMHGGGGGVGAGVGRNSQDIVGGAGGGGGGGGAGGKGGFSKRIGMSRELRCGGGCGGGAGSRHPAAAALLQVVSPSREQLQQWRDLADDVSAPQPDADMYVYELGDTPAAYAHAYSASHQDHFRKPSTRADSSALERVESTDVTAAGAGLSEHAPRQQHCGVAMLGANRLRDAPLSSDKDIRLTVGRNGVYSARELKRTSVAHIRGGLGALVQGVGGGKEKEKDAPPIPAFSVWGGDTRGSHSHEKQSHSYDNHEKDPHGAGCVGKGGACEGRWWRGGEEGTRRGATRGVMLVTDDLDGLPAEIAAARLRRRMLSDVWSSFQQACAGLFIGGVVVACRESPLREAGITHIVNVTPNEKDFFPESFTYMRIPVTDTSSGRLDKYWEKGFKFISEAIGAGGKVFVHCSAGVSRSASLVIYFMMRKHKMSLLAAYKKLKMARGCVAPNFSFWQQLVDAELSLASGSSCSVDAYKIMRLLDAFPCCTSSSADAALKAANGDMDLAAALLQKQRSDHRG